MSQRLFGPCSGFHKDSHTIQYVWSCSTPVTQSKEILLSAIQLLLLCLCEWLCRGGWVDQIELKTFWYNWYEGEKLNLSFHCFNTTSHLAFFGRVCNGWQYPELFEIFSVQGIPNVSISNNPFACHLLSFLRSMQCKGKAFRIISWQWECEIFSCILDLGYLFRIIWHQFRNGSRSDRTFRVISIMA